MIKKFNENFTKDDAEALGLCVGTKIACRKPIGHGRFHEKTGSVYQLWKNHFIVIWDKGEWKEAFRYHELQRGKIKIKG